MYNMYIKKNIKGEMKCSDSRSAKSKDAR